MGPRIPRTAAPPPRLFTSPLGSTSPPHLRPGPHAPFSPGPSGRWQGARCGWSWRCLELGGRCLHRRPRALSLPGPLSSRRDAGVLGAPEALLLRRVRTMGRFEEQKSRRYGGVGTVTSPERGWLGGVLAPVGGRQGATAGVRRAAGRRLSPHRGALSSSFFPQSPVGFVQPRFGADIWGAPCPVARSPGSQRCPQAPARGRGFGRGEVSDWKSLGICVSLPAPVHTWGQDVLPGARQGLGKSLCRGPYAGSR